MSVIVNLRGPGGSGKTTSVRKFMKLFASMEPIIDTEPRYGKTGRLLKPRILGYQNHGTFRVVGSYETDCGGCDTISDQATIRRLIEEWADAGYDVVFEGLLISSIWGTWLDFGHKMEDKGHTYVWAFMNTPLDQCVKNIYKRNGGKPIKESLVKAKWDINQEHIRRTSEDGFLSFVINNWEQGGEGLSAALEFARERR